MKKKYWVAGLFLALQTLIGVQDASASSRASKKIGLEIGVISEPFPSVIGYNLCYNIANPLRLSLGYGSISVPTSGVDVTTIALDAKYFLLDWNFAPFIDAGVTMVSGTLGSGTSSVKATGTAAVAGAGIDLQTNWGFNLGVEYKMQFASTAVGLPGVYFGWFF